MVRINSQRALLDSYVRYFLQIVLLVRSIKNGFGWSAALRSNTIILMFHFYTLYLVFKDFELFSYVPKMIEHIFSIKLFRKNYSF